MTRALNIWLVNWPFFHYLLFSKWCSIIRANFCHDAIFDVILDVDYQLTWGCPLGRRARLRGSIFAVSCWDFSGQLSWGEEIKILVMKLRISSFDELNGVGIVNVLFITKYPCFFASLSTIMPWFLDFLLKFEWFWFSSLQFYSSLPCLFPYSFPFLPDTSSLPLSTS